MERILFCLVGLMLLGGSAVALHLMKRAKKAEEMICIIGIKMIGDLAGKEIDE